MGCEIERKWVLESESTVKSILAGIDDRSLMWPMVVEIDQGYLEIDGDHEVRLRRSRRLDTLPTTSYFLTEKSGTGLVREEIERPIDQLEFNELWPRTKGRRIEKIRHSFEIRKVGRLKTLLVEIDEFLSRHAGLLLAEIEFTSKTEAQQFNLRNLLGPAVEVTLDNRYKNRWLAEHGIP